MTTPMFASRSGFLRAIAIAFCFLSLVVLAIYFEKIWTEHALGTVQIPLRGPLHFPYLGAAAHRAILATGSAAVLMIAAGTVGAFCSRHLGWRFADRWEAAAVTIPLGMAILPYVGLALAGAGFYTIRGLQTVVVLVLFGAAIWAIKMQPIIRLHFHIRRADWLWLCCAAIAAACALLAALAPEVEYDALWYHLTYPRNFLEQGHLVAPSHDFVSLYPMTFELWFGYGLALDGPVAAKMLHFACLPLTGIVTFLLCRRFGGTANPWLAVAIFVATPSVMWEASTAYIDLGLALYVTLVVYALLRFDETGERQWLFIAALFMGIALAIKHLALIVLAIVCTGLAARRWTRNRDLRVVMWPSVLIGIVALSVAAPWYVRSWMASHNPVFPELYWLFGADPDRWNSDTQAGLSRFLMENFGRERTLGNMLTLPWDMSMHAASYRGLLGPLFLLLLPVLFLRSPKMGVTVLILFASSFFLFWASPISSFQMRFLMPVVPLLSVLAASGYARASALLRAGIGRHSSYALKSLTTLLLILNLPFFTAWHERDRTGWQGWLSHVLHGLPVDVVTGRQSEGVYLAGKINSYRVWSAAVSLIPADAHVLTWSSGDHFYTHFDRLWIHAPQMADIRWSDPSRSLAIRDQLKAAGLTHMIVERSAIDDPDNPYNPVMASADAWAEQLYRDDHYVLYRIR